MRLVTIAWFMLALLLAAPGALAQSWDPGPGGLAPIPPVARVTDLTRTLDPREIERLEAKLADWEARTSNQLVVLMVPTTWAESIESYTLRVAETWKIGRKGQDNGVVFLIATNDRRMRIEVGYGLEGTLTDVTAHRIIEETVAPAFREGWFAGGINAGVDRIIAIVEDGKPLPPLKFQSAWKARGDSTLADQLAFVFIVMLFLMGTGLGQELLSLISNQVIFVVSLLLGSMIGAGALGAAFWLHEGSLGIPIFAAIVSFVMLFFLGLLGGWGGGPGGGGWISGGGGGGGGGFSGGGGGFGGGGASGRW